MSDDQLVPGPTAGQLDVWSRVAGLGIPVGLVLGLIFSMGFGVSGPGAVAILAVLVVGPAIASTVLGVRAVAAAKLEKAAGYSTMFDFVGYELRDPRTRELLRAADVKPTGTVRRSLYRSLLTVKPGTMLAKRLEEDERAEREG